MMQRNDSQYELIRKLGAEKAAKKDEKRHAVEQASHPIFNQNPQLSESEFTPINIETQLKTTSKQEEKKIPAAIIAKEENKAKVKLRSPRSEDLPMRLIDSPIDEEYQAKIFGGFQLIEHYFQKENKLKSQSAAPKKFTFGLIAEKSDDTSSDDKTPASLDNLASTKEADASTTFHLGLMHLKGQHVPRNIKKAVELFLTAIYQKYAPAQYYLGSMYEKGQDVPHDDEEAARLYSLAAEQGHVLAQHRLGLMYEKGYGVSQNYKKAAHLYSLAAKQGHPFSQYRLAWMHCHRIYYHGVPHDDKKAVNLYTSAAEQNYAPAQYQLGLIYKEGRIVRSNKNKSAALLKLAHEQGYKPEYTNDQWDHYLIYQESREIPRDRDDKETYHLYQLLADQKNAEGQYQLGLRSRHYREMSELYHLAATQGHAEAQYHLGLLYEEGQGALPQSNFMATKLYRLAAEQGHAPSQCQLGCRYVKSYDHRILEGVDLLNRAAMQGNAKAQYQLGKLYKTGLGTPRDDKEAVRLFHLAADQRYSRAQYELGLMYQHGRGVPPNNKKALRLFHLAADQGLYLAQTELGVMYQNGVGVAHDEDEARHFLNLAVERQPSKSECLYYWEKHSHTRRNNLSQLEKETKEGNVDALFYLGLIYKNGRRYCHTLEYYDLERAARCFYIAAQKGDPDAGYHLRQVCNKMFNGRFGSANILFSGTLALGLEAPDVLEKFNKWAKNNPKQFLSLLEKTPHDQWKDIRPCLTDKTAQPLFKYIQEKWLSQLILHIPVEEVSLIVVAYLFNGGIKNEKSHFSLFATQPKTTAHENASEKKAQLRHG
jgi:TPR repeat protein